MTSGSETTEGKLKHSIIMKKLNIFSKPISLTIGPNEQSVDLTMPDIDGLVIRMGDATDAMAPPSQDGMLS